MKRAWLNRASLTGLLLALGAAMAGCSPRYPMDTLSNGSDFARRIHGIYVFVNWIDFFIMVVVLVVMFLAMFWYSTREGEPGEPSTVTSDIRLEVLWTAIPALILVAITVPTIRTIWATQPDHWPKDALEVKVIAHQWWWEFRYPQYGIDTADEVHLQAGRMVHFSMQSADIIHSFWIPALGGKRDVVPGQINSITYTPDQLGEFYGQCVEFCGDSHANMRLRGFVQSKDDFDAWVKHQQAAPVTPESGAAARGAKIFADAPCAICHTVKGISGLSPQYTGNFKGPDLTHFGSRTTLAGSILDNTPENLAKWIQNPDAIKPGANMPTLGLQGQDLNDLVAYLESLK
ncbi:MAG TPA: cytochrome c oxidase subunit II [Candidatus Binataceae bacterium]|nr:cytochrome c oxidase subunit II [Candidatus Binataceae bacterium]